MIDRTFLNIMQNTGQFPSECHCEKCKNQCKTPCLGTPHDILRLIKNGHKDNLALTFWMFGMIAGQMSEPVIMVQLKSDNNGCVFFKNGLCNIHYSGMKPTEGRLSNHRLTESSFIFEKSISWNVAKEWLKLSNLPTIIEIFLEMGLKSPHMELEKNETHTL